MNEDDELRDTERLIPIREETGLPPPHESGTRRALQTSPSEPRQK